MLSTKALTAAVWIGGVALCILGFMMAREPLLWSATALALPFAVQLAGASAQKTIVLANLGLFWVAIFGSILSQEFSTTPTIDNWYEQAAIYLSCSALFAIAIGYRLGYGRFARHAPTRDLRLSQRKLLMSYWASYALISVLSFVAYLSPLITQPILAFSGVKLLLLYLVCAQIFQDRSGFVWIAVIVVAELVQGATGYIASYQLPLLVVLAACLSGSRGTSYKGQMLIGCIVAGVLLWASIVWTAIKPDYRAWLASEDPAITEQTSNRVDWVWRELTEGRIDYGDAFVRLTDRIGYTHFYALALPRLSAASTSFWRDGILNVLMPRAIFTDKAVLDDTKITSELTGREFGRNTSVSIGFVAQAHADFGFPLMFIALTLVGVALGATAGYFQSGERTQVARDGFIAAALVYKFTYEQNIDKAIGGFVLSTLALVVIYRFVYPSFEAWALERPRPGMRINPAPVYARDGEELPRS